jgi:predicted helicase
MSVRTIHVRTSVGSVNLPTDRPEAAAQPNSTAPDLERTVSSRLESPPILSVHLAFEPASVRTALYRPFTRSYLYFADIAVDESGKFFKFLPARAPHGENLILVVSDVGYRTSGASALCCRTIADLHVCAASDGHQCFPFYVDDEGGGNRRENVTDWALEQFRTHYGAASGEKVPAEKRRASRRQPDVGDSPASGAKTRRADAPTLAKNTPRPAGDMTKWDIFYYVYGILHHPGYRTKFADNLKRELPRIPFAPDFWAFSTAGKELARLHLDYEQLEPYKLKFIEMEGVPLSYRVEDKMRLCRDKTELRVNPSLTLAGLPPQTFEYRLGNRSALEWVTD